MTKYPYYIVRISSGRLPTPIQFRCTPIAKMFEDGKIGGKKFREITAPSPEEAQQTAFREDRPGQTVEVFCVQRPNTWRIPIHHWRARQWQIGRERIVLSLQP